MALINCSVCGKQISDKAVSCPHCGAAHTPLNTTDNAFVKSEPLVHQATKSFNMVVIMVGAIVSLLIVALIVVVLLMNNGDDSSQASSNNNSIGAVIVTTANNNYAPPVATNADNAPAEGGITFPATAVYNVNMSVACEENDLVNRYDVDILVDGKNLATLAHGTSEVYAFRLEEGSHSIEFRIAGLDILDDPLYNKNDAGSYKEMTFNLSGDTNLSYYVKLDWGNDIEVEMK